MKIISWNVNGIRSVFNKGFLEWFDRESPDILCLQEIKAREEQFPSDILGISDYKISVSEAEKAGYSGVANFIFKNSLDGQKMENPKFDKEGRVLIHEDKSFFLFNCYFPNGQRDHGRVPYKLEFCKEILKLAKKKEKKKPVIITGDFNTAHHPIDLANPKSNKNTTGFLPIEREWLDKIEMEGFVDIYRFFHPDEEGAYTWWTYRNNCRKRNIGWRIDYFYISEALIPMVKSAEILQDVLGSDHCPISIELDC